MKDTPDTKERSTCPERGDPLSSTLHGTTPIINDKKNSKLEKKQTRKTIVSYQSDQTLKGFSLN